MYRGSIMATLLVRDVVGSVAYYRDVLGFDFRGYGDDKTGSMPWP